MSQEARRQFGPLAQGYLESQSHATGRTLALVVAGARAGPTDRVLDVATGAGHTALALAPGTREVIALDPTATMVETTLTTARHRGLFNVHGVVAAAERLPFVDGSFDVLTCRTAAHHFDDLPAALAEMRRVLRPGGRLALTDLVAFDEAELRELQHALERLHDATHRRTYTSVEWRSMLEVAGFRSIELIGGIEERLTELDPGTRVGDWCRRSRTPAADEREIRRLIESASPAQQSALGVRGADAELRICLYKIVALARA